MTIVSVERRVLPSPDACECAGGFESLLRGQEGFEPQSMGRRACGQERGAFRNFGILGRYTRAVGGMSLRGGVEVAASRVKGMEEKWR